MSMPRQARFVWSQATIVVPLPRKGSKTRSPSPEELTIARRTSGTGFIVGCSSLLLGARELPDVVLVAAGA